jgi:hypothetical protein
MASEIKVDTISEKTSANGVTIDGVSLKDSKIATANSVDSDAYVDGSIDAVHLSANSVDSDAYVDGSIDTAHIDALQVTGAKLNTDVISAQTELAAEPADADEFMVSDGGVLKRIDYSLIKGGANTPQFRVYLSTIQTISDSTSTKIEFNSVQFDDDDIYDETTNYDATLPSTGKWFLGAGLRYSSGADFDSVHMRIFSGATAIQCTIDEHRYYTSQFTCGIFNITNLANTITVHAYQGSGGDLNLDANIEYTFFYGYKLI